MNTTGFNPEDVRGKSRHVLQDKDNDRAILAAIARQAMIERHDDSTLNQLGEMLSTHPMIARRIEQIRKYAATNQYAELQAYVNGSHR